MLSVDDDAATRSFGAELGVDIFLTHPVELVRLHEAVHRAFQRGSASALKIAIIRDREAAIEIEATGLQCLLYFSMEELLRQIPVEQPDVVLLGSDVTDPQTASILRMCAWDSEFSLLSFEDSPLPESTGLDGRLDREAGWIVEVHRHAERVARGRAVPLRCPKTGLLMNRAAVSALESGLSSAQRHGHTYSVGFVRTLGLRELDPLRADRLQTFLGRLIAGKFRREDVRGRFTDDTFVLGFDGASARAVVSVVQRLQAELETEQARYDGDLDPPRIAAGLAAYPLDGDTHRTLIRIAHERLEAAVRAGPGSLVWR
jgi:GGDEF domain-containing protein